jgi:aspartyl-tRNA synthetase
MSSYRTHYCNELRKSDVGQEVKLSGWVCRSRDHGNLLFIDLRDHYGIVQLLVTPESGLLEEATHLRYETVITIKGKVLARSDETVNKHLATGEIEVAIEEMIIESEPLEQLPFPIHIDQELPEDMRLRYRFLDLRREKIHNNIILRSNVIAEIRKLMHNQGFNEFQTPILTASSPEGARDYLVPSRVHPGKFYALPQAPQQFKQLLMVAGFDKYFQIAPCFRDEDARADRSPGEFYQLDIEMSFVTQEDVFAAVEPLMYEIFTKFSNKQVTKAPFPRISYHDSMLYYGSDKPDLRIAIKMSDATEIFRDSGFSIFASNIAKGAVVRAIPAPNTASKPRSFFDGMIAYAQSQGAKGLAYIIFSSEGETKGPIAKFLNEEQLSELKQIAGLNNGDAVFFTCDVADEAAKLAGKVRVELGNVLELIDHNKFEFCWIVDFPYFEWNDERKSIDFSHNPFSMPQGGMQVLQDSEGDKEKLLAIKAFQYDIVCNGIELSSGAIRNHKPEIMYKAFDIVGYNKEIVDEKFSGMIKAFTFGAPPHGGIAPGVDRMVMLLANEPNIREVIAFPMNQQAQDLMMNAPATVDVKQLKELSLMIDPKINK